MNYPNLYLPGSFVKHINRPDVKLWVVVDSMPPHNHSIKSIPDKDGNYEIIYANGPDLICIDNHDSIYSKRYYRIK